MGRTTEVGETEALELALLLEVVHTLERFLERSRAVGGVEVPQVDGTVTFTPASSILETVYTHNMDRRTWC